jgi:putative tryptophan/tyrosine transport system substrate-binding protein
MTTRREFIMWLGGAATSAACPRASLAQPLHRAQRIGFLHPGGLAVMELRISAFRDGLGSNIEVIARVAEGDVGKLPAMTSQLLDIPVDAILAVSPTAVRAATAATRSVPIVAVDLESDPIANSWVSSLARPGGNVTGIFFDLPEFSAKLLQLLREVIPSLKKIAILWDPETGSTQLDAVKSACAAAGVTPAIFQIRRTADLDGAFQAIGDAAVDGVLMLSTPVVSANTSQLASLALRHKLPAITIFPEFAQNGGLLAYGPELQDLFRQSGVLARKVLQGAKPAELPVERPTRFRLVANVKIAGAIGVTLPTSILLRADEVIE